MKGTTKKQLEGMDFTVGVGTDLRDPDVRLMQEAEEDMSDEVLAEIFTYSTPAELRRAFSPSQLVHLRARLKEYKLKKGKKVGK